MVQGHWNWYGCVKTTTDAVSMQRSACRVQHAEFSMQSSACSVHSACLTNRCCQHAEFSMQSSACRVQDAEFTELAKQACDKMPTWRVFTEAGPASIISLYINTQFTSKHYFHDVYKLYGGFWSTWCLSGLNVRSDLQIHWNSMHYTITNNHHHNTEKIRKQTSTWAQSQNVTNICSFNGKTP